MEELQGLKTGDGHMDCFVMSMLVCIGKGNASESLLSQRVHDASRVALRCQRKSACLWTEWEEKDHKLYMHSRLSAPAAKLPSQPLAAAVSAVLLCPPLPPAAAN